MARNLGATGAAWVTHHALPSNYWMRICPSSNAGSSGSTTAGAVRGVMLSPGRSCTLNGLALFVTTGGVGAVIRFGLYDASGTGFRPGNLIADFGTVSAATSSTMAALTGLSQALVGGRRYWVCMAYQGNSFGIRTIGGHTLHAAGPNPNDGQNGLTGSSATGALNATWGTINISTTAPDIYFRVS